MNSGSSNVCRKQQEAEEHGGLEENPALVNELRALRLRKHELETHLTTLQDSKKHLKAQLDNLMKLLQVSFVEVYWTLK